MKKNSLYIVLSILILLVFIGLTSFKIMLNNNYLTNEVANVEYAINDTCIKKIEIYDPDAVKIEIKADQELIDKIRIDLENSFTKIKQKSGSSDMVVGVLANEDCNCGPYSFLRIYMDTEDKRNANENGGRWIGCSGIVCNGQCAYNNKPTGNRLGICVVTDYGAYFERTNVDYAVLLLGTAIPENASTIVRYFDNENDRNANNTWEYPKNGNRIEVKGQYRDGECYFGTDTRLAFIYYPKTTGGMINFPPLGFSYGVIGRFGNYQGYLYYDDEDSGNKNYCTLKKWLDEEGRYIEGSSGNIPHIMDVGTNTRLYISKATSCR